MKLSVVAVELDKKPYEAKMTFNEIQDFVGGWVEQIHFFEDFYVLMNEEGIPKNLPVNRAIPKLKNQSQSIEILGNFVIAKQPNNEYESLTDKEVNLVIQRLDS